MIKPGMFISDRYEIVEKVGSGGMADVYKARCHRLNRFVAIKVLKTEYSNDKNFVSKFRAEAQSVAGLSHPNIVNVYDVGDDDGLYYIVMELVEGITLKNFIERKGKLEVKEAVGITIQIAQGMEAAHDNHIIHRDIKPQNIIISREGKVKVTDFGIAKAASSNTISSNTMGSVHYISPEQARGGYSDEKSDIYSLGVTLYEMLCGKVPFEGDNTVSVALLHIQGEAVALRELDPSIPVSLERIVQKCMQKKPERRYLYASELIADLKRSIMNPDGAFVKIAPAVVDSSPTITISDEEVNHIKNATKIAPTPNKEVSHERKNKDEFDDIEDDSDVDPRLEKITIVGGIVVAVLLCAIILFVVAQALGLISPGKKSNSTASPSPIASETPAASPSSSPEANTPIVVPDFAGKSLKDAQTMIDDLKLTCRYETEASDVIEKDYVISQTPEEGEEVSEGATIELLISSGPEAFPVPDVYNKADTEAETILTDAGLDVKHAYEYSDTVKSGYVISTNPVKGENVYKGDSVTITLSKGKEVSNVKVPDLNDLTLEQAVAELAEVGLKKGTVTYEHSSTVAEGLVFKQDYSANEEVEEGTKVNITISSGPEEVAYIGTVSITMNPFTADGQSGFITLLLEQDGQTSEIEVGTRYYKDFPLNNISITGRSESKGTIKVYVDGNLQSGSYEVTFQKEVVQ